MVIGFLAADSIPPWQSVAALIHTEFGVVIREARRIIQVFAAWHSGLIVRRCSSVIKCLCIQDLVDCLFPGPSGQLPAPLPYSLHESLTTRPTETRNLNFLFVLAVGLAAGTIS